MLTLVARSFAPVKAAYGFRGGALALSLASPSHTCALRCKQPFGGTAPGLDSKEPPRQTSEGVREAPPFDSRPTMPLKPESGRDKPDRRRRESTLRGLEASPLAGLAAPFQGRLRVPGRGPRLALHFCERSLLARVLGAAPTAFPSLRLPPNHALKTREREGLALPLSGFGGGGGSRTRVRKSQPRQLLRA